MSPIRLEELESRSLMAAAWNPAFNGGYLPFPDAPQIAVRHTYADVDANGSLESVFVAGEGGGCRVKILDGGTGQFVPVPDPDVPGQTTMVPAGRDRVLFDGFAFADRDARIGLDVAGVADGSIYFTWLTGGGPIISRGRFDVATGSFDTSEFLAADPNYRGGLLLTTGTVRYSALDFDRPDNADLLVMPSPSAPDALRGGPILRVFTSDGDQLAIVYDDPDDRTEHRIGGALVGLLVDPTTDEYGFVMDSDGGLTSSVFTWSGRLVSKTTSGDTSRSWRNENPWDSAV